MQRFQRRIPQNGLTQGALRDPGLRDITPIGVSNAWLFQSNSEQATNSLRKTRWARNPRSRVLKLRFFPAVFPRKTAFWINSKYPKQPHAGGRDRSFPRKSRVLKFEKAQLQNSRVGLMEYPWQAGEFIVVRFLM
jgi:hypothetical protein